MSRALFYPFWGKVQVAFPYLWTTAVPDRPRLSEDVVEELLDRTTDRWLTPHVTGGFQREAFLFLPTAELDRLSNAVEGLRVVAEELRPDVAATPEQKARAKPHFRAILKQLEFERYADADAYYVGKLIEKRVVPYHLNHLNHLRFMTGLDSTGDPALWVWAFVKEKESGEYDQEAFFVAVDKIDPILKRAAEEVLQEVAPERWPYISYRSTLDQPELEVAA